MAKISFGKTVKYQGSVYPPNTVFEVSDSDVADLKKAGGWVKEEPKTEVEPEKSELDLLRDEADKLGIKYKGNWGVKKLTETIAEAKAQ
jgi:hypothetical protein